ncbi:hypothetical protein Tco_1155128 [Tanacetum coccineum]
MVSKQLNNKEFHVMANGLRSIMKKILPSMVDKRVNEIAKKTMPFTWMAFGGNTRDLGSIGEETNKTTTQQTTTEEKHTEQEMGDTNYKRHDRSYPSDKSMGIPMAQEWKPTVKNP